MGPDPSWPTTCRASEHNRLCVFCRCWRKSERTGRGQDADQVSPDTRRGARYQSEGPGTKPKLARIGIALASSLGGRHETSTPPIPEFGSGRCRAPCRFGLRKGANLSDAAYSYRRRCCRWRPERHRRAPARSMAIGTARPTIHCHAWTWINAYKLHKLLD